MYGPILAIHKAFVIIETPPYLLKIDRSMNKKYLCDSNFEIHFLREQF